MTERDALEPPVRRQALDCERALVGLARSGEIAEIVGNHAEVVEDHCGAAWIADAVIELPRAFEQRACTARKRELSTDDAEQSKHVRLDAWRADGARQPERGAKIPGRSTRQPDEAVCAGARVERACLEERGSSPGRAFDGAREERDVRLRRRLPAIGEVESERELRGSGRVLAASDRVRRGVSAAFAASAGAATACSSAASASRR